MCLGANSLPPFWKKKWDGRRHFFSLLNSYIIKLSHFTSFLQWTVVESIEVTPWNWFLQTLWPTFYYRTWNTTLDLLLKHYLYTVSGHVERCLYTNLHGQHVNLTYILIIIICPKSGQARMRILIVYDRYFIWWSSQEGNWNKKLLCFTITIHLHNMAVNCLKLHDWRMCMLTRPSTTQRNKTSYLGYWLIHEKKKLIPQQLLVITFPETVKL